MRIPDSKPVDRISPLGEERAAAHSAPEPVEREDKVSVSSTDDSVEVAAAAVQKELATSRAAHLAKIEAAVRSGSYKPDPRVIAERILQSAALDAQIDAALRELP